MTEAPIPPDSDDLSDGGKPKPLFVHRPNLLQQQYVPITSLDTLNSIIGLPQALVT